MLRSGADAFACVCGNHGCFECHASAAGLVRHWRAKGGDEAAISLDCAKDVVERMRAGEPTATAAWTAYRADLAAGLANLVTFYNPSLIVLGGKLLPCFDNPAALVSYEAWLNKLRGDIRASFGNTTAKPPRLEQMSASAIASRDSGPVWL